LDQIETSSQASLKSKPDRPRFRDNSARRPETNHLPLYRRSGEPGCLEDRIWRASGLGEEVLQSLIAVGKLHLGFDELAFEVVADDVSLGNRVPSGKDAENQTSAKCGLS
jgi:hypothetical protein